jgi:WD40 repeat protein
MSKQFSSLVPCGLVCYSPSSDLIATESSSRINVRSAKSLKVKKTYSCIDRVEKIEFSPDSALILCALYARSAVQVFSLSDTEWNCRIDEGRVRCVAKEIYLMLKLGVLLAKHVNVFACFVGIAGITDATWSPDSRNVIVISDYGVQISIWSLTSNQCHSISNPKHIPSRTSREINSHAIQIVCFSDCHRLMAGMTRFAITFLNS